MQKPANWDTEQTANIGEYETLEPGGYICVIRAAEITQSKQGKEMLVLSFDIADGLNKDYYAKRYKSDNRSDKKWGGTYRQLTEGDSLKYFKGLINNIEKSNSGYKFDFNEQSLVGKYFGGVFGREEYYSKQKGEYLFSTKLRWTRDVETIRIGDYDIPNDKPADRNTQNNNSLSSLTPSGFQELHNDDGELPF